MPRRTDRDGLYKRKDSPYWWASYVNGRGKRTRQSTGATGRKEAEAILAQWKVDAHKAKAWNEGPSRTFDELALAFIRSREREGKNVESYLLSAKHLYPAFSGRDIRDISSTQVRKYIAMRKQQGAAASSINKETGFFCAAINYANREWGWDLPNPASKTKLREPEGRVRWLTREEVNALIKEAEKTRMAWHLADFIRISVNTGCRRGELLSLEWKRVNLKEKLVLLEANHTKGRRRRSIPLNREAHQAMLSRARFRAAFCPDSPWVFCYKDGRPVKYLKATFTELCARVGIKDFRVHDLRHTCASWLVMAGVPLAEVRELLGHRSIAMTERYAHLSPDNVRRAVGVLDAVKEEESVSHVLSHVKT